MLRGSRACVSLLLPTVHLKGWDALLLLLHAHDWGKHRDWQMNFCVTCGCEVSYNVFINVTQVKSI